MTVRIQPRTAATTDAAELVASLQPIIAALACIEFETVASKELGTLLVDLEAVLDSTRGILAQCAAAFVDARGYENDGASSMTAWQRQELRLTASETRRRARAAVAMAALPATRDAHHHGEIGAAHVDAIAAGVHRLGADVIRPFESVILDVARTCDADAVRHEIDMIAASLDPDAADAAYIYAFERRDITLSRVGEGFAVGGFLDPETGSALKEVLYAGGKPDSADDLRAPGQRRCDALRELCLAAIAHGLPTDRGIRPQLFVTVDSDRLVMIGGDPSASGSVDQRHNSGDGLALHPTNPPILHGYGPVSDQLVAKLACDCALTPVIVDGRSPLPSVLDVGRSSRLATLRQRQAILVQQGGTCFSPGCDNTHLEIHHMTPWSRDGRTDLANLRGYCTRCHHLIHHGRLVIKSDGHGGWLHTRRSGERLVDHRRMASARTRSFLSAVFDGGIEYAESARGSPKLQET